MYEDILILSSEMSISMSLSKAKSLMFLIGSIESIRQKKKNNGDLFNFIGYGLSNKSCKPYSVYLSGLPVIQIL